MERVAVTDLTATDLPDAAPRRELGTVLGATDVAVNHYTLAPGEALAETVHGHADQEEVFYVLDGAVSFDVRPLDGDRREVVVGPGQVVRFAPGDLQRGHNAGERPAELLAVGAPPGSDELHFVLDSLPPVPEACPDCGNDRDARLDGERFVCPTCGTDLASVSD